MSSKFLLEGEKDTIILKAFRYLSQCYDGNYLHQIQKNKYSIIFVLQFSNNFASHETLKTFYEKMNFLTSTKKYSMECYTIPANIKVETDVSPVTISLPLETLNIKNTDTGETFVLKPNIGPIIQGTSCLFNFCIIDINFDEFIATIDTIHAKL